MKQLELDGASLKVTDITSFVRDEERTVSISPKVKDAIASAYQFVQQEAASKVIYGVNTGFGPMASHIVSAADALDLQRNLIRSHACGAGTPLAERYVLGAMIIRLNTLAKGYSGVSPELLALLQEFINRRIVPVVPEHGAVGTSGDLVQLAHIALALIGEGEVAYKGKRYRAKELLQQLNLAPHRLRPKEGLSLINGTSMMTAMAALICADTERLLMNAIRSGALALELVRSLDDGFSERLQMFRPHRGQTLVASILREILSSSKLTQRRIEFQEEFDLPENGVKKIPKDVQEIYSFRCIPQIVGPVYEAFLSTLGHVEVEMNSVTDNPIVDWEQKIFLHGGNFHGDYIALAADHLKIALVKLTMLSERRINFFLNEKVNRAFPPFLNLKKPGLTLALQGLQFVATSTTAQSQTCAFPQYVHSIPTNADNQDVVSMGTDATLLATRVLENANIVLAIELATLAQAVDCSKVYKKLSHSSKKLYDDVRNVFPTVIDDRPLSPDLEKLIHLVRYDSSFMFPAS